MSSGPYHPRARYWTALFFVPIAVNCGGEAEPRPSSVEGGGSGGTPSTGGQTSSGGAGTDGTGGSSKVASGGSSAEGTGSSGGQDTSSGGSSSTGGQGPTGGSPSTGGTSNEDDARWPLINGVQWADTDGNPINAHGGGMLKVDDHYYWFGENRNPDGTFNAVSAYRSKDLHNWEHAHDVLTMMSNPGLNPANVERPKVVYNAATGKYVMWMHWENGKNYEEARAAVASSESVDGDYTYHGSFRPLSESGVTDHDKPGYMSRDCTLFVDDDGVGYFLSAANENYDLHLYRLTNDYLKIDSRVAVLFEGGHREAPALFKRRDRYFLISSGSTGWSPNQAKYASSADLLSGWSDLRNIADGNTFYSQSTYVQAIEGSSGTEYLYMGDRWAGAWGGKVNDSSYLWQKIEFPTDSTLAMRWNNLLEIESGQLNGTVATFYFVNKESGLPLVSSGDPSTEGASLMLGEAGVQSDDFRLNYNGAGYFALTHETGGTVIDVPDESTEAGVELHLWSDNDGDHQVWKLIDLGAGQYKIRNKNSGLYMTSSASPARPGTTIEQQPGGGDAQIWHLTPRD